MVLSRFCATDSKQRVGSKVKVPPSFLLPGSAQSTLVSQKASTTAEGKGAGTEATFLSDTRKTRPILFRRLLPLRRLAITADMILAQKQTDQAAYYKLNALVL